MASFKNTFTDLGELNTKQLEDDYVSGKLFTNKIKGKTTNKGNFTYKHVTVLKEGNKLSDNKEIKLDFPLTEKFFFWYGVRNLGDMKLHLDFGNVTLLDKKFNPFVNLKRNFDAKSWNLRLGSYVTLGDITSSFRVEVDHADQPVFTARNFYKKNSIFAGFVASVGLNDFFLRRADVVVGYNHEKFEFTLRHLNSRSNGEKNNNTSYLGRVVADAVYKHNDKHTVAVQAEENFGNKTYAITAGHTSKLNDKLTLKNRFNNKLQWGSSLKYKVCDVLTFTASTQVDLNSEA